MRDTIVVGSRFRGPPGSGNGGYSCGLLGVRFDTPVEVTLRLPPPLEVPLALEERPGGGLAATDEEAVVMEAFPSEVETTIPGPVSLEDASAAAASYEGFNNHAFPMCFVCGPEREEGDGLRIFPGDLGAAAAAPWIPHPAFAAADGTVPPEIVWAALDCPTGWSTFYADADATVSVLGRLAARILAPVRAGETYVAAAWPAGRERRKHFATGAIMSVDGDLVAVSRATWVELKT